jgi:hypothetical protein
MPHFQQSHMPQHGGGMMGGGGFFPGQGPMGGPQSAMGSMLSPQHSLLMQPHAMMGGVGRGGHHVAMMPGGRPPMGGFNPLMMGMGMMPHHHHHQQQQQTGPTQFVSVALVPETVALQPLFNLLEVWGTVLSIRRNQNKKEIVTVKMGSVAEAETVSTLVRGVPFFGGKVSAKPFPTYSERHPATAEGDPTDPSVVQYEFSQVKHRNTSQRSRCKASATLKLTGAATQSEATVMGFLSSAGYLPSSVRKDEAEGYFTIQMDSVENAVKLVAEQQWAVCGEEKSNLSFTEEAQGSTAEPGNDPQQAQQADN